MSKYKLMAVAAAAMLAAAPAAYGQDSMNQLGSNLGMGEDGGGPGCGLGTQIHAGKSGIASQLLAASTNGTFSNSFAITSGTSGCSPDGVVLRQYERDIFAALNLRNIQHDVARGQGEYLTSLASIMGINSQDRSVFSAFVRDRSALLLSETAASSEQFLTALDNQLAAHPQLARYAPITN